MAGSRLVYQSPDGSVITEKEFRERGYIDVDDSTWILERFENDKISIEVRVLKWMHVDADAPAQHWKGFHVAVFNIIADDFEGNRLLGKKRIRDIDASKDFRTREEAIGHYRNLLLNYTASYMNGVDLVEVGNKFDPNLPQASGNVDEDLIGSW